MAKQRNRPAVNPLLRDRVRAIVEPVSPEVSKREITTTEADTGEGRAVHSGARHANRGRVTVQIKARFTESEAEEVRRFARTLSSYLRSTVNGSEVTRALWTLAIRSQDELAELAVRAPRIERPPNGDRLAMAQYEDAIADFLLLALKRTRRG